MSSIRVRFVLPDGTPMTRSLSVVPGTGHLVRLQHTGPIYVAAPPEHLVSGMPCVTVRLTLADEHRDDPPIEPEQDNGQGRPFKTGPVYRDLVQQATDRDLLASPYADRDRDGAFISGYEAALSDLANGSLKMPARGA